MEKIQITKAQEQKLISFIKSRVNIWIVYLIIGVSGLIPVGVSYLGDSGANFISSPTMVFFILGLIFWSNDEEIKKKINAGNYQVYKTECRKIRGEYASVDNNEILSKKLSKPEKYIQILGSAKSIQIGTEIGILQAGKEFLAFSLQLTE